MATICCLNSETGATVNLQRHALRSAETCADAEVLVQDLWDMMPRNADASGNMEQLAQVRRHLRAGYVAGARLVLDASEHDDSETSNLRGLVAELEGDFRGAERHYRAALAHDALCSAAELNLRRCYELWTFGRSCVPHCL